jgi:ribonuclease E
MVLESNRDLVLRRLTECLGRDRTRHQVSEVTSLGLVQMTRKRVGQGLLDEFSTTCEHCRGRGVIVSSEPVMGEQGGGNGGGNGGEKAGSAEKNGSGDKNGSGEKAASGTGGGSSSRRGRRGRRAERSEGASPAVVAAASGLTAGRDEDDDTVSEEIGADETATDVVETVDAADSGTAESPETAAVPVEGAEETEVALEAGLAEASPGAGSVEETDEAPAEADVPVAAETEDVEEAIHEAVEAEVALEADLAEHVPGGNGTTPEPATSSAPRVTGAIGAATGNGNGNGHGGDTVITPAGSPAEPEDDTTPEPAVVPTGSGSARPRRRRAASRPAGPPVGGSSD